MGDLTKLLTLGKLEEKYQIGNVTFTLTTPPFINIDTSKALDPADVLCHTIVKIDDETFASESGQEKLKAAIGQMQGALVAKLLKLGTDLTKKQVDLINEITVKKE